MREAALSARPPELTRRTLLTASGHAATGGTMTDGQAGHETRPPDQRAGSTSIPAASPAQSATAPVAPTHHGVVLRGLGAPSASATEQGRFGRMFRHLPVFDHEPAPLTALAASMIAAADPKDTAPVPQPPPDDDDENPNIPAGYTYLGQFVDHDITFDPTSSLQRQNDPDALHDFRTPRFDLDSLYGRGPADQPYLYLQDPRPLRHPELGFDQRGVMFLLGRDLATPADAAHVAFAGPDLPRNPGRRSPLPTPTHWPTSTCSGRCRTTGASSRNTSSTSNPAAPPSAVTRSTPSSCTRSSRCLLPLRRTRPTWPTATCCAGCASGCPRVKASPGRWASRHCPRPTSAWTRSPRSTPTTRRCGSTCSRRPSCSATPASSGRPVAGSWPKSSSVCWRATRCPTSVSRPRGRRSWPRAAGAACRSCFGSRSAPDRRAQRLTCA